MVGKLVVTDNVKVFASPAYNYIFNVKNGSFARWGKTHDDDPFYSPYGPEIADVEISVGDCSGRCEFCYKSNQLDDGKHMSIGTFKAIIDKFPPTLTQVALGLTDIDSNVYLIPILEYCRKLGIVPNFTISGHGIDNVDLPVIADLVGAVAVSVYPHTVGKAYNALAALRNNGFKQINIHLLYHSGNLDFVKQVLLTDSQTRWLSDVNAIVLLGLKNKGRGINLTPATYDEFVSIVDPALKASVPLGFDSCSAPKFVKYIAHHRPQDVWMLQMVEPCESTLFSIYVDVEGNAWPCSFCEGELEPVSVLEAEDFMRDVWNSRPFTSFRAQLKESGRQCPVFELD